MSRFQRMIVIPEEEYRQMLTSKTPTQQQFLNVQRQHEEESLIKDPYSRLVHQGTTLDVMKSLKEKMKRNIASSTPKPFRGRASRLYAAIEPHIDFNDRGEILDDAHHPIAESHIEDLVQYAVRDHRRNIHPRGWSYFLDKLRDINVPKVSLNRETIKELSHVIPKFKPVTFKHAKDKKKKESAVVKVEESDEEELPRTKSLRKQPPRTKRYPTFYYY